MSTFSKVFLVLFASTFLMTLGGVVFFCHSWTEIARVAIMFGLSVECLMVWQATDRELPKFDAKDGAS